MCCLLASETLARTGVRGRLVVLEARVRSKGRGLAGPGRSLVSTALTSTPHRRRTPKKNRRIPTIPTGCFGGRLVHVSAVDTGPRGSESGVLGGRARRCRGVEPPPQLSPTLRRLPRPAPATWGPITRYQHHDLKHRALSGARAKARRPWFNAGSAPLLPRVGLLHEGRDLLTTGCAYCTKAPPTRSTPNPRPVAPHPRAVRPNDDGSHHSHRVSPLRQTEAAALPSGRPTPPMS